MSVCVKCKIEYTYPILDVTYPIVQSVNDELVRNKDLAF